MTQGRGERGEGRGRRSFDLTHQPTTMKVSPLLLPYLFIKFFTNLHHHAGIPPLFGYAVGASGWCMPCHPCEEHRAVRPGLC